MKRRQWRLRWGVVAGAALACCGQPTVRGGDVRRTQIVVAPATVQLVPVVAFFRVGEAARESAVREQADREGYSQGRADAAALAASPVNSPLPPGSADKPSNDSPPSSTASPDSQAFAAAEAVVRRSCVRCHTGDKPAGGVDLSDPGAVARHRLAVFKEAYTGRMPPNGPPLSDDDVKTLLEFLIADDEPARASKS